MTRLFAIAATAMLLAAPALAQEGGSVFTNNPNELPQFLEKGAPTPEEWAGQFFHSQTRPVPRHLMAAERQHARDRAVN
ncbi:MAG TPA: hypothetical protein VJ779_07960 [Acetobacteraceae bacterium]|jgi:hypothetical protein|nr:hypothetical protein [Acetobacteraceae bacterium]